MGSIEGSKNQYVPIILETAVGPRQKVQDFESESLTIGVEHSQKGHVHLFGHFPALFKFFYHRDHREHRDFCSLCVLCDLCGRNLYKCFPNLWNTENSSSKGAQGPQKVKATPSVSDYGSKDCAFCPDPTAVSRIIPREWLRFV